MVLESALVRFLPISLSLLLGTYTIMWMLVDWCSPISPTDHLYFIHFFFPFWATLIEWVLLLCLWLDWSSASSNLLLNLSSVFFSSIIVSCSILPKPLLQFSLCSYILLPSSVSILMTITSNYLSVTYLHFINFFSDVSFYSSFATYSSVPSLCLTPCLNFYTVDKTTTSPSPEGMTSYRKWTFLFNLPQVSAIFWISVLVQVPYYIVNSSQ